MTLRNITSGALPGIYPHISTITPAIKSKGQDYIGMGYTQHDEQFLLKPGGRLGTAEFVGAALCGVCGIPACQPTVVTIDRMGTLQHVFGSRIESGLHQFNQTDIAAWNQVTAQCSNLNAFSALLAIDLALGNDDRHWNNWMVQPGTRPDGSHCMRLRALDFSRAWPVDNPAQHPLKHRSANTWRSTKEWGLLGISFHESHFYATCAKISGLSSRWLKTTVLHPLTGVYLTPLEVDQYCQWWDNCWKMQVIEAIDALENGARP